jgi:hypothetical protein
MEASAMSVATEVDVRQKITTKEELEDLKERLKQIKGQASNAATGKALEGKPNGWQDDVDGLVAFLEDLKEVMKFLIGQRVLKEQRQLFLDCWEAIEVRIDIAIAQLRTIRNDDDEIYVELHNAGLTKKPLGLKLREYFRRITSSPVPAVLEMADRILGSLFPILVALEPVKEFKETLESKLKHDGDAGLQDLNLSGREQWWKQASKSA